LSHDQRPARVRMVAGAKPAGSTAADSPAAAAAANAANASDAAGAGHSAKSRAMLIPAAVFLLASVAGGAGTAYWLVHG